MACRTSSTFFGICTVQGLSKGFVFKLSRNVCEIIMFDGRLQILEIYLYHKHMALTTLHHDGDCTGTCYSRPKPNLPPTPLVSD